MIATPLDNSYPRYGTVVFNNSYGGTSCPYSGGETENYVESYVTYLTKKYEISVTGSLITKEELESLGCSKSDNTCLNSEYEWIYSTSYWAYPYNNNILNVYTKGAFGSSTVCGANATFGVRPVITISKDIL